jgi:hypothetical protein
MGETDERAPLVCVWGREFGGERRKKTDLTHGLGVVGRGPVERPRGVPRGGQRLRWRLGILLPLRPAIKRTLPLGQSWEGTVGMRAGAHKWVDG